MLDANASPSSEEVAALPNICRCGAYPRIRKAIARAARAASKPEQTDPKRLSGGSSEMEQKPL